MKILLLGANGQVGWELHRSLAVLGELTATARQAADGCSALDLSDADALRAAFRTLQPDVVVNAAAYTAVDKAEQEPELAAAINTHAVGILANEVAQSGGWLLHYSTDYVFDGSGQAPRDETAPTAPLSTYGRTKLAGEELIRASGCQHLILRTSWVHAARGGNFARTMLRLAAQRDALKVVDDQMGAPTGADLLADLAALCLRAAMAQPTLSGTYHACASGAVSWCDYARHVIAWGQRAGLPLRATVQTVAGIPTRDYPTPAARPLNSRLDTRKLQSAFGVALPSWQSGVDRMLTEALPSLLHPHT
jgi:dTDP-4-dehydrorhamnose reductase